jgi:hypothetical protein
MKHAGICAIAAAATVGAVMAYFFDRTQGARRRAVARDKVQSGFLRAERAGTAAAADLSNRLQGATATIHRLVVTKPVTNTVLAERIRARLGRVSQHPASIDVKVENGRATLSGPVLEREVRDIFRAASSVRGVNTIVNRLEVHEQPNNVPGLQGGRPRLQRFDIMQEHWAPATRMLVGGGGAFAALTGILRPTPAAPLLVAGGAALLARALTNLSFQRMLNRGGVAFVEITRSNTPTDVEPRYIGVEARSVELRSIDEV